jgi:hypothetical protein
VNQSRKPAASRWFDTWHSPGGSTLGTLHLTDRFLLIGLEFRHYISLDEIAIEVILGRFHFSPGQSSLHQVRRYCAFGALRLMDRKRTASEHRPCRSVHFGGYCDNDGTGSAIEFLRYALAPSNGEGGMQATKA